MPIIDHFRPPVTPWHPWESFHSYWAVTIGEWLNNRLPPRYYSLVQTHIGRKVETDIVEMETFPPEDAPTNGSVATAVETLAPPVATMTAPAVFPDSFEVRIRDSLLESKIAAVIELVSPGNLDRPETRRAFAAKCAAYLQRGIGVIAINIVTIHLFNLHNELAGLLLWPAELRMPDDAGLYVASYAPTRRDESNLIDFWPVPLAVGGAFPTLPIALRGGPRFAVDLDSTYNDARRRARL